MSLSVFFFSPPLSVLPSQFSAEGLTNLHLVHAIFRPHHVNTLQLETLWAYTVLFLSGLVRSGVVLFLRYEAPMQTAHLKRKKWEWLCHTSVTRETPVIG